MTSDDFKKWAPEYHGTNAPYVLPNDEREQQRLITQHNAWKILMDGKVVHAPISNPQKLVDVGCGTGVVSRELAAQYPGSQIYGVDLSTLETHSQRPANLEFIQGDIRKLVDPSFEKPDNRLAPGSIDFIFQRLLVLGMTDWPGHIKALVNAAKPGSWIELQELDFHVTSEDGTDVTHEWPWQKLMIEAAPKTKDLDLEIARKMEGYMKDAGLTKVTTVRYRAPIGAWDVEKHPKTQAFAEYMHEWWPTIYWVAVPNLIRGAVDEKALEVYKQQMLKDLEKAEKVEKKAYEIVVCYGQKPEKQL